jgi:hypothetical protein
LAPVERAGRLVLVAALIQAQLAETVEIHHLVLRYLLMVVRVVLAVLLQVTAVLGVMVGLLCMLVAPQVQRPIQTIHLVVA